MCNLENIFKVLEDNPQEFSKLFVDDSIPENKLIQTIMLIIPEIENKRRSIYMTNGMR